MPNLTRSSGWWWRVMPDSSVKTLCGLHPADNFRITHLLPIAPTNLALSFIELQKHQFQLTIDQRKYHPGVHVSECVPMHNSNCNVQMSVRVTMHAPGNLSQDGSKHAERWGRYTH